MLNSQTITTRNCDCCNKIIDEPTFYKNDGSFQSTFVRIGKNDLCMLCALEILSRFKNYLPEDKVTNFVEERRKKLFPLENIDLKLPKNIFDDIKFEKKD